MTKESDQNIIGKKTEICRNIGALNSQDYTAYFFAALGISNVHIALNYIKNNLTSFEYTRYFDNVEFGRQKQMVCGYGTFNYFDDKAF